jgi:methanogenic corrinoid protein MtbC1
MQSVDDQTQLIHLLADLQEEAVLDLVNKRIDAGDDPLQIVEECNEGMRLVGKRYEKGEYFISGLIMSGEIFTEVVDRIQPLLEKRNTGKPAGKVLVGTVSGDIHDIGKNMFGMLLSCHGFDVIDLGVDVPPRIFSSEVIRIKPDIVGLSGLITASLAMMKDTVVEVHTTCQNHNLRIPVVIGGSMIDEQVSQAVGADYWAADAMEGVRLCQRLMQAEGPAR